MKRRTFITLLGGAAASWPLAARAQQATRISRIGLMANLRLPPIERFRKALQEMGHFEGRNLVIEYRFAEGSEERYPDFASELVALPVDVIVTWGTPAAFAAKEATSQIPIVMGGHWGRAQYRPGLQSCSPRWKYHGVHRAQCRSRRETSRAAQGGGSASVASGGVGKQSQPSQPHQFGHGTESRAEALYRPGGLRSSQ